jgi:hypothetical protein
MIDETGNGNISFLKLANKKRHEHLNDIPRREKGHIAIVTFKIDIRPVNSDNTFENYMLAPKDLEPYGMSNKAQIIIKGSSEADCVMKVKKTLEKMND